MAEQPDDLARAGILMSKPRMIRRRTVYEGRIIRLIREVLDVDGHRLIRETVLHPGAVVMVPMLDRSRIVFVRQYRRAIRRYLLELPAGTLASGERPSACAQRELEEEVGFRAKRLTKLGQFYAAPGFASERMTVFLAEGLTTVKARPEADELLTPVILSLSTALAKIRSGAICDAKTIIGLWWAQQDIIRRK